MPILMQLLFFPKKISLDLFFLFLLPGMAIMIFAALLFAFALLFCWLLELALMPFKLLLLLLMLLFTFTTYKKDGDFNAHAYLH